MDKTVLGIFHDQKQASDAINSLENMGYNPEDISIAMKNEEAAKQMAKDTGTSVTEGAVSGVATGAIIGALAGLLAATVIPGIGVIFIGGPLAAALGLEGAAALTASGAVTGLVAGGLIGALTGWGLSPQEAQTYQDHINQGGILVAVPTHMGDEAQVRSVLDSHGADQIRSVSAEAPAKPQPKKQQENENYGPAYYSEVQKRNEADGDHNMSGDSYDDSDEDV